MRDDSSFLMRVDGLSKNYGDVHALKGLSFDLLKGRVKGLIGPNGAGKTTAIECMSGILQPSSGTIAYGFDSDPGRPLWCLVPQEIGLYAPLTALENIIFFGTLTGRSRAFVEEQAVRYAAELAMSENLARPVETLSVGQQRLVHLLCAIVTLPHILLLDEVTAGVDADARYRLSGCLRRLAREYGIGVLFSSHYLAEVEEFCDDVLILNAGRQLVDGQPEALIKEHGKQIVEIELESGLQRIVGVDFNQALAQVKGQSVISARVLKPSLYSVMLTLCQEADRQAGEDQNPDDWTIASLADQDRRVA